MTPGPFRRRASVRLGLLAASALAALPVAWAVGRAAVADVSPPLWDPAKYMAAGARLAAAVGELDLVAFVARVHGLSLWPPGFPLLEMPFLLAFGPREAVAEGLMAGLFALLVVAAAWAGFELGGEEEKEEELGRDGEESGGLRGGLAGGGPGVAAVERGDAARREGLAMARGLVAGGCAAALVLASPFFRLFGGLAMLEVPGALGLMVAVALYARSLRPEATVRAWRAACLAAAGLFFVKYNYGVLWIAPLALAEAARAWGGGREAWRAGRAWLRGLNWRRPWPVFLSLYLAGLALLALAGEAEIRLAGQTLRGGSLGNPLYALFLLVLLRHLILPGPRRAAVAAWRRLGARARTAWAWIGGPIALWLLLPPHLKDLVRFAENRSSGLGFGESLAFYPRAWFEEFVPAGWVGVAVALLALRAAVGWRRLGEGRRAVLLALGAALTATALHPYKEARFFSVAAPLLALAAALALGRLVVAAWGAARRGSATAAVPALAAGLALALLAGAAALPVDLDRLAAGRAAYSAPPATLELLDTLADLAVAPGGAPVLLGSWNGLSPALVELHLRRRHPGQADDRLPRDPRRLAGGRDAAKLLDRAAADPSVARLLLLEALPGSFPATGSFAEETAWLEPARQALATDPRYFPGRRLTFAEAGYRLRVYRKREAPPAH